MISLTFVRGPLDERSFLMNRMDGQGSVSVFAHGKSCALSTGKRYLFFRLSAAMFGSYVT